MAESKDGLAHMSLEQALLLGYVVFTAAGCQKLLEEVEALNQDLNQEAKRLN